MGTFTWLLAVGLVVSIAQFSYGTDYVTYPMSTEHDSNVTIQHCGDHDRMTSFPVARLQWHEVDIPIIISLWILFASLVRLGK